MTEEFDIERFVDEVRELHPELAEVLEGTSGPFETNQYEQSLAEEFPDLADGICKFDEKIQLEETGNVVSKKQQARDRKERLEGMISDGRTLYEQTSSFHDEMHKTEGPMELVAEAVRSRKRIEVRTRSAVRIDRIFEGIPTTFDEHFNLMMDDVTETVLHGRKSKQEVGLRKQLQASLPEFLRWIPGGKWPMPIGANRLIEHRTQRSCFIKGDSVVLIRRIP